MCWMLVLILILKELIKYNSDIGFIGLSELLREDNYRLRVTEKINWLKDRMC